MTFPVSWVVFVLCFAQGLWLAAPGLCWLDGGELALAAATLGVAHPPGEPFYMSLAALAALLPVGDLSFRLTVLSAGTVACAAALLSLLAERAWDRLPLRPEGDLALGRWFALAAGLLFGIGPSLVLQAVRPELYGLAAALGLLAVLLATAGEAGRRGWFLAALPLGALGATHPVLLAALLPPLVLGLWPSTGRGRGSFCLAAAASGVVLLAHLPYLRLRSLALPPLDYGGTASLSDLLWTASGAAYAGSLGRREGQVLANAIEHLDIALDHLGLLAALATLVGAGLLVRASRRVGAAVACGLVVGVLPTVLQGVFTPSNPDAHGSLVLVLGGLGVLAALGLMWGVAGLSAVIPDSPGLWPLRRALPALVLAVALLAPATGSVYATAWTASPLPSRWGGAVLDESPPGGLLFLGGDSWAFPALYLRSWEGRRPDLGVAALYMLDAEQWEALAAAGRGLQRGPSEAEVSVLEEVARGLAPEATLVLLSAGQADRPLLVNEAFLPHSLASQRRAWGPLYWLGAPDSQEQWEASVFPTLAEERLWSVHVQPVLSWPEVQADRWGQGVLGRRYAARAGFYRETGAPTAVGRALERGAAADGNDSALVHLMRYRWEEGLDKATGVQSAVEMAAVEEAFLGGAVAQASRRTGAVLDAHPTHPRALLLAERLRTLGWEVPRLRPAVGPATAAASEDSSW